MQRKPEAFLWDISEAASRISEFVGDLDFSGFSRNALVRAAVERQFEIIGEALSQLIRVAPETASQIPDAPRIVAFRNILIHGYAVLDHTIVWSVIRDHLPEARGGGEFQEVREAVWAVNGTVPVAVEGTMAALYAESLSRTRFTLVLLAVAGGMALLLGVVGVYGVIAYVVSQRRREIGIRAALGAGPRGLARTFLLYGLAMSGVGIAVGVVAALLLGRLMSSLLFGVGPVDPVALVAAVGVTLAAAGMASYLPARRVAGGGSGGGVEGGVGAPGDAGVVSDSDNWHS